MNKLTLCVVIASIFMVGGCATTPRVTAEPSIVDVQIAESAARIQQAWTDQAPRQSNDVSVPQCDVGSGPGVFPAPLDMLVTFDWNGELGSAVEALAQAAGYSYRAVGAAPSTPILVMLRADGSQIGALLRDAGLQAGDRADVVVRSDERAIEVFYKSAAAL